MDLTLAEEHNLFGKRPVTLFFMFILKSPDRIIRREALNSKCIIKIPTNVNTFLYSVDGGVLGLNCRNRGENTERCLSVVRYYIRDYQWRTYDVSGAGVKKIKKGTTCIGVLSYSEERAPIPFHSP